MDYSKLSDNTLKALKAGQPLDYSKLSDDELKALSSSAPANNTPDVSKTESALRGAAQGASLGFADELTGGAEALKDVLSSNVYGASDIPSLYKQHRNESRAAYDAAQKANPLTYAAGELGGSFALPAGEIFAPAEGAGLLSRLVSGAKAGAAIGAGSALGNADELNMETSKEALKQGAIGLGAGAAVTGAAAGLGKAGENLINKYQGTRDLAQVFNAAKAGESMLGEEAANKASQGVADTSKDYINTILGKKKEASDLYEKAKALESSQSNVPVLQQVQDMQSQIQNLQQKAPTSQQAKNIGNVQDMLDRLIGKQDVTTASYKPAPVYASTSPEEAASQSAVSKVTKNQLSQDEDLQTQAQSIADRLGVNKDVVYNQLKKNYGVPDTTGGITQEMATSPLTDQNAVITKAPGQKTQVTPVKQGQEPLYTPIQRVESTETQYNNPAVDVNDIKSRIQTLKDMAANADNQYERDAYNATIQKMQSLIPSSASTDAYDQASTAYKQASDLASQAGLDFGYDQSHGGKLDLQQAQKNVGNQIRNYLPGKEQKTSLDQTLDTLAQTDPYKAQALRDQIQQAQDAIRISGASVQRSGLAGGGLRELTGQTARAATMSTADVLGKIAGTPRKIGTYVAQQGRAIYNAAPEELQSMVDTLHQQGSPFAAKLQSALNQPDRSRKAILFALSQDPGFRQSVGMDDGK